MYVQEKNWQNLANVVYGWSLTGPLITNPTLITSWQKRAKGLISLSVAGPQEIFKKNLIKEDEQPSFSKIYSAHFGEVSTL